MPKLTKCVIQNLTPTRISIRNASIRLSFGVEAKSKHYINLTDEQVSYVKLAIRGRAILDTVDQSKKPENEKVEDQENIDDVKIEDNKKVEENVIENTNEKEDDKEELNSDISSEDIIEVFSKDMKVAEAIKYMNELSSVSELEKFVAEDSRKQIEKALQEMKEKFD